MSKLYTANQCSEYWTGRKDALENEYLFQVVQSLDLDNVCVADIPSNGYAILGFECDEGVRRNLGRPGAKDGPNTLREAVARLPAHKSLNLFDAGNVQCINGDLHAAQLELSMRVAQIFELGLMPIVFGGGHETAFGHYHGINQHFKEQSVAILNFDAHFDLREPSIANEGSSGTPFRQINTMLQAQNKPFNYYCAGIQELANTSSLFDYADRHAVKYLFAEEIECEKNTTAWLENIIAKNQHIYVTVCLDVFNVAFAPGVSAPQALGINPSYVVEALKTLKKSGKVVSLDIVELAPKFDIDKHTAKLAAALFYSFCMFK